MDTKFDYAEELGLLRRALAEPVRQFILVEFDSVHRFRPVLDELVALAPERHAVILDFDFRRDRPADLLTTARSRLGVAGTEEIPLLVLLGADAFEEDPAAPLAAAFWKAMNLAREAWDSLGTQLLLCLPIWSSRQAATHADHLLAWASLRIHLATPPDPSGWFANEKPLPSVALLGDFGVSPSLARERLVELRQSWQQAAARSEDPSSFVRRFFIPMLEAALAAGDLPAAREARDAACSTTLVPDQDQPRWHELNLALAVATHQPGLAEEHANKLLDLAQHHPDDRVRKHAVASVGRQAQFLLNAAEFSLAEPLLRRGLAIDERNYSPDHPNLATALNNLAQLLQATNRLAEAEPLLRRSLAINERSLGPEHPAVATALNNLAQLLQATNRLAEAEPLMRRALAIDERSFSPNHPKVTTALNNLAQLLMDTNRLAEAEPLMRQALAIDERSLGSDHPKVATTLNNLARLLQDTNRLAEAEPLLHRALAIDESSLGPDHPNVARDLNNLATILQTTNRQEEAEPLMRRSLAIAERSYSRNHPRVATALNNLAQLLKATNRLAEAEPLMRRMVEIFLNFTIATGHLHPHLNAAFNNYSALLTQIGDTPAQAQAKIAALAQSYGVSLG